MASILTNASALQAIQALAQTQRDLATTQSRIATGLRVQTASDDPSAWVIAQREQGDVSALGAVSTALNLGTALLAPASAAVDAVTTALQRIQSDVVEAGQSGASPSALQQDVAAQQQAIVAIVGSASFNGTNLLDGSSGPSVSVTDSFQRTGAGTFSLGTLTIPTTGSGGTQVAGSGGLLSTSMGYTYSGSGVAGTAGTGTGSNAYAAGSVLAVNITNATTGDLANIQAGVASLLKGLASVGTVVGGATTTVANMQTYEASLSASLQSGIGSLVDADLNVESTRLQALQTQQQLGIQALSIANENTQLVLKLFQVS